jgi:hypothetical protein
MLNEERSLIQNSDGYPRKTGANYSFGNYMPNKYEYATADSAINRPTFTSKLEDNLMKVRAAFGLPVHGDPDIARTMRYFLYNRFKSPDINMAHNRSFTHVFFTRPELNILDYSDGVRGRGLAQQCQNHTEAQLLWLRNPIIFQLLSYNGDVDNFNLMLSNAVQSFDFEDEYLTYLEMGRSWQEHAIQYGDSYNGRAAGEVSLRFIDDKDYSIINMIKLWITYIDNVSRGAWKPSYNNISSHGFNRTIDYGASMYVFKVAEDGSDVLYWTKYYGIFPLNTGASALSWETGQSVGEAPRLNIRFRYSMKRDMSPISLVEFNSNAKITTSVTNWEEPWSEEFNHSNRPFVGSPFIELAFPDSNNIRIANNAADRSLSRAQIRLKFRPASYILSRSGLNDRMLYRNKIV